MSRWWRNLLALTVGLVVGIGLLEAGLALLGEVKMGFWPGKTTVKLTPSRQGVCYAPGSSVALPYDARIPKDRTYLKSVITGLDSSARFWTVDRTLDETPQCLLFDVTRGYKGGFPGRTTVVPVLGDSFAFGEGLPQQETLWVALARLYTKANFPNLAFRGANIDDLGKQVDAVLKLAKERTVGHALYFYNLNDLDSPHFPGTREQLAALENEAALSARFGPDGWLEEWAARSRIYWALAHWQARTTITEETISLFRSLYADDTYESQRHHAWTLLEQARATLDERGITLHVVLYPTLAMAPEGGYLFAAAHETVLAACRDRGLRCYDGADAVFGAGDVEALIVHPEDRHPNGLANEAMARFVVSEVLE